MRIKFDTQAFMPWRHVQRGGISQGSWQRWEFNVPNDYDMDAMEERRTSAYDHSEGKGRAFDRAFVRRFAFKVGA